MVRVQEWSRSVADDISITFEVKAPHGGAFILLSPRMNATSCIDCFELVIGASFFSSKQEVRIVCVF